MYVFDGDRNGVINYLATDYGRQQWVNPVSAHRLVVKASSPASRYTDPKVRNDYYRTTTLSLCGEDGVYMARCECT